MEALSSRPNDRTTTTGIMGHRELRELSRETLREETEDGNGGQSEIKTLLIFPGFYCTSTDLKLTKRIKK